MRLYASGHVNRFNGLHISAAYVGLDNFSFILSGSLLFLNTVIAMLSTALVWLGMNGAFMGKRNEDILVSILGALYSLLLFVVMSFTLFARRHLMVQDSRCRHTYVYNVHKVSLLSTTLQAVYSKDTLIEMRQKAFFRRFTVRINYF